MTVRLPLVALALVALAVLGVVLVATGGDDGPDLESITTADGVITDIPAGWVVSEDFDFQYVPPGDEPTLDIWSVAWVCPPNGCTARTLPEWLERAPDLPTFAAARAEDGIALFDIRERNDDSSWVLTATTNNDLTIVNVAVFDDGSPRYLACNLVVQGEPGGLDDAVVDACREAVVPE